VNTKKTYLIIKKEDFSAEESLMKQWEQEDAVNPLFNEQRLERLEIFKEFVEKEGLTTISPRLPDGPSTPNQGTTMD
jgi:thioredoxin reductase